MGHVSDYLESLRDDPSEASWLAEVDCGKMLGVLVVRADDGALGFLAAFSGTVTGSYRHHYFVPPLVDLMRPRSFYLTSMARIDELTSVINGLYASGELDDAVELYEQCRREGDRLVEQMKSEMSAARERREAVRSSGNLSAERVAQLEAESRFLNAELKRLKRRVEQQCAKPLDEVHRLRHRLLRLESARAGLSRRLQQTIFTRMKISNTTGETITVLEATHRYQREYGLSVGFPPGGTGECCAPKLLQYAFSRKLQPLCMGEMWWGTSPVGEVRRHGLFYPSCAGKCKPLLHFMLQGLDTEPDPLDRAVDEPLQVLYDDRWLSVVNKPAGMLSQEGKLTAATTVERAYREIVPQPGKALVAHRLDMDTSGIMVIAKNIQVLSLLHRQFATGSVSKCYIAVLDGCPTATEGEITLPLAPCLDDRPRQKVDMQNGKPATTRYRVLETDDNGHTRVEFFPLTGRTHQLRVHAAHVDGLNAPIVGDRLYGTVATRLLLHATSIQFIHPVTGQQIVVKSPVPF